MSKHPWKVRRVGNEVILTRNLDPDNDVCLDEVLLVVRRVIKDGYSATLRSGGRQPIRSASYLYTTIEGAMRAAMKIWGSYVEDCKIEAEYERWQQELAWKHNPKVECELVEMRNAFQQAADRANKGEW